MQLRCGGDARFYYTAFFIKSKEQETTSMIHRTQSCTLGAILVLSAFLPGCAEDNQKSARVGESVATKDNKTDKERQEAGVGTRSGAPRPASYPKPNK